MSPEPNIPALREKLGYEPPKVEGKIALRGRQGEEPLMDDIVAWCRVRKRHISRQELLNEDMYSRQVEEAKKADSGGLERFQEALEKFRQTLTRKSVKLDVVDYKEKAVGE